MTDIEPSGCTDLIVHAAKRGVLQPRSAQALQQPWVMKQIDAALEESYGIESAGEVLLVTLMPDDSQSMTIGRKNEAVIQGHNELLQGFKADAARDRILLQTRYLNGCVINPFEPLSLCIDLTNVNYICNKATPLFEQTVVTLGTVIAKTEELLDQGAARVRTATLIMTDAQSTDANEQLRSEVASVVADMRQIGDHIIAGMGFSTSRQDEAFRNVFLSMGIEPEYIFGADSRDSIIQVFRKFGSKALELTTGDTSARRVFEG